MSEDFSNATPRSWSCKWNGTCWQIDGETDAVATTQFCYADDPGANARLIVAAVNVYRDPRIMSGEIEADVERVRDAMIEADKDDCTPTLCAARIEQSFDPCPRCGATMDESCPYDLQPEQEVMPAAAVPTHAKPVATTPPPVSEAGTQPADDEARLAEIKRKYRGLQGDMPPFGDVIYLLRKLDEARAARDALAAKLAKAREVLEAIDWNEMSGAEAARVAHNACVVLDDTGGRDDT